MLKLRTPAALVVAFLMLVGCAQTGQQPAQTPEDGLRYSQAVLTGLYKTVGDAAEQRTIPAADARSYFQRLEQPKKDLDAADAVLRGLPAGAAIPADTVGKIQLASTLLTGIADELRRRLPASATATIPAKR